MSPPLRGLKARQVIRAFERAGGKVKPARGDHVKISMPNGNVLILRGVGEVGIGLLKDLIDLAGMTPEQFLKYVR